MSEDQPRRARVFLIDDHLAMRSGLSLLLTKSGHVICGEAETRAEVLARLKDSMADVALVDLTLGDESGLDLIDDLLAHNVTVVIDSMHEDRKTVERAFVAGAAGYVTKREVADVLLTALDQVLAGNRYASPRATKSLANRFLVPQEGTETSLSSREEQIVTMIGRAETSEEIAETFHSSVHTVKTYYARIIEKLGIAGMKELRKFAALRNK